MQYLSPHLNDLFIKQDIYTQYYSVFLIFIKLSLAVLREFHKKGLRCLRISQTVMRLSSQQWNIRGGSDSESQTVSYDLGPYVLEKWAEPEGTEVIFCLGGAVVMRQCEQVEICYNCDE